MSLIFNDKVSIVIPIYNTEEFLIRCIESVINQTYKNIEIILVNDGSTDNSKKIIEMFAVLDNRIVILNKINEGLSSARNSGVELSTGSFIVFLDSDDYINKVFIEKLVKIQKKYNCDVVSCLSQDVDIYGNLLRYKKRNGKIYTFNKESAILGLKDQKRIRFEVWNKMFKKELIKDIKFKEKQIYEDIYFDREVFFNMNYLVHTDEHLHFYTVKREGNTNSSFNIKKFEVFDEISDFCILLQKNKMKKQYKIMSQIGMRFAMNLYVDCYNKNIEEYNDFLVEKFKVFFKNIGKKSIFLSLGYLLFRISPHFYLKSLQVRGVL